MSSNGPGGRSGAEDKRVQRLTLLEDHIGQALAASEASGELRRAPSFGRPLGFGDGYDETPAELRMPMKILKDAGVAPPEIEMFHERARLKRGGAVGAAKLFWIDASRPKRLAVAGGGGLFLLMVLALFVSVLIPEETKKKKPEATEVTDEPIDQSYGVGEGVSYERVDQKEFDFQVKSPVDVMVVLHYQCSELSENEVSMPKFFSTRAET